MARNMMAVMVGVLVVALAGCGYSPGGSGSADDTYTYYSTAHEPKTIALVDTRTSETLWTYEIPVNRQLTVAFYEDQYSKNPDQPARMHWREFELGRTQGKLTNQMPVPDHRNRRLDQFIRPHPEYPGTAGKADAAR